MKKSSQRHNRYYLIRHGESVANRRGLIVSHPDNALTDFGLTSKGSEQVTSSALSTRLGCDTLIISSDFLRARETATIMHSVLACNEQIQFCESLRERDFGDYELTDDDNYARVWQHDLSNPDTDHRNVESVRRVLTRALSVIDDVERNHRNRNVLLVGHGDVLQILLSHHHQINPRFHRSLHRIRNAEIRSLAELQLCRLKKKIPRQIGLDQDVLSCEPT